MRVVQCASVPHSSLNQGPTPFMARRVRYQVFKFLVAAISLAIGYHGVKLIRDERAHPAPGTLVNVDDHRLHLFCEGDGEPAVVLDAGAGAWSIGMRRIQRALRDSIRVCAYDRAGLGWSDASRSGFDVQTSAGDLHRLVEAAPIARPFILVGESLGANIAQVYASDRPEELAGLVLIDPGTPDDMLEDFHHPDSVAEAMTTCGAKCGVAAAAAAIGLTRVASHWAGTKWLTQEENAIYKAGISRPRTTRAIIGSLVFLPKSAVQVRRATDFGDLPVTVLFSEKTRKPEGKETVDDVRAWHALKLRQMSQLLEGSTAARGPIVVPGATHTSILFDSAAVRIVAAEILRLARKR